MSMDGEGDEVTAKDGRETEGSASLERREPVDALVRYAHPC